MEKKILIRCDSGIVKGAGHLNRCLALASELRKKTEIVFVSKNLPNNLNEIIIRNNFEFIELSAEISLKNEIDFLKKIIKEKKIEIGVFDNYDFDKNYYSKMRKLLEKIVCIDDIAHSSYECDILINQNVTATPEIYDGKINKDALLLLGKDYIMLRPLFFKKKPSLQSFDKIQNVLITMGAGDSRNQTLKSMQACIDKKFCGIEFYIVIGGAFPFKNEIFDFMENNAPENFRIFENVENMRELMEQCQLALCAGGSTCWELAYLGIPMIVSVLDDNQIPIAEFIEKNKIGINLGWYEYISIELYKNKLFEITNNIGLLNKLQNKISNFIDGKGSARIAEKLFSIA